jgi:DNA-binding transcriptional LysR family regulator
LPQADAPGRITLWELEVFVATSEERSISAAARRLGASASSVSQQLSNLEAAVGTLLLNRRERPVTLTPAGEMFRKRAYTILNETVEAKAELAKLDPAALTQLRLGMIEDFDASVTPLLLAHLASGMSSTQFLLETGASHRLYDLLDTRGLDLIVAADMGAAADWMEIHPLLCEPFVAVAPKGAATGRDPLARLKAMPLIEYTKRHHMGRVLADHLARQNLTLAHRYELDSYHAILAMVASGAGWTILTPLGVTAAQRFLDQVDILPLPFAPLSRTISLSARRGVLGDMPAMIAEELRKLLQDQVVEPARLRMPWLEDSLRLL